VLAGAVASEEFANNSEIFLAHLPAREPFSSNLRIRSGATPARDLSSDRIVAAGQIAVAIGTNLALAPTQTQRLADGSFPRVFKNTGVTVNGRAAQIFYVSPTQVNFQIPDEIEDGAAEIAVRNHDGYESRAVVQVARTAPAIFTERTSGTGAAIALDAATLTPAPFDPHDAANDARRVIVFATGAHNAATLSVNIAGRAFPIERVVPSNDLPGLDELHVALPRSLAGAGTVPLSINADGRTSNEAPIQFAGQRRAARIVLTPASVSLGIGRSQPFDATAFDEDGFEIPNAAISYSTSDARVAIIDQAGIARGLRSGETTIIAVAGDASARNSLIVYPLTLVINEVLADPPDSTAGDANRDGVRSSSQDEFVEIANASDVDLDLGGYKLATLDANGVRTVRHVFAPDTILAPGTAAVVFGGANAATFNPHDAAFGGALVFNASTDGLSLLNGGETVQLLDASGALIEEMTYGGATALAGDRNQSLTRAPDIFGDFALHQSLDAASSRAFSPGTKIDGTPFTTTAPIARIEISPASASAQAGASQQFNARAFDETNRELSGVIFRWQTSDATVATIDQSGTARALKVGSTDITASARGAVSQAAAFTVVKPPPRIVRVEVTPAASMINRGATVQLTARAFDRDEQIVSDATFTWRASNSAIVTVDAGGLAHGVGIGATTIEASADDGAGGIVAARATFCVKLPIIISEILADVPPDDPKTAAIEGDANRDGVRNSDDDEFVELFNPSDAQVDLSNVRVADATTDRLTFPAHTTLGAHRALVIFGGGAPPVNDPAFGGALIFKTASLGLNDTGDTVSLKLKVGDEDITLASQSYGSQGGINAPSNQSLTRERDANGVGLTDAFVAHLSATNAAARAYSPGTLPDGTPFDSAPIARIEITPTAATLDIGASQTFNARAFASTAMGEIELANVSFAWDVSDASKATVAQASGASTKITAVAHGEITVRARAGGRESSATLKVNPLPPVLTRVELSPANATIFVGGTQLFTARAFDQFDQPFAGAQFAFTSSDANLATIDLVTNGASDASVTATVTGRHAGAARINATASDGTHVVSSNDSTLQIILPPPIVKSVVVSPVSASVNRGQSQQFTASAFDQYGQPVANVSFTWTTTGAQIATVTTDGLVRGVGLGAVEIVATTPDGTGGTVSGRATLTVRAPLVINEILADVPPDNANTANVEGDANRDGIRSSDDDEFVELLNNSDAPLDLSGVVISDSTSNRFTFPAGTTLGAGQAAVVFGGGSPNQNDPAFCGARIFTTGSLGLNDGGDTVTVKLPSTNGEIVIASQSYGSAAQGATPAPTDQSLTRSPDAEVNGSGGGFVAHANALNSAARSFSPGTRADGTPFGSRALTRIEIAPASVALDIGAHQTFNARAFTNVGGAEIEIANVSFIWDVTDATKATLAPQTGASTNATAVAAGTTSVRARAGGLEATESLTVKPPPPVLTTVTLAPTSAIIIVGQSQQFIARAFDQFNQPFVGATFNFSSDDTNLARVESATNSGDGSAVANVSARGAGTAQVTATVTSGATVIKSNPATLTINPPPPILTRITVSPSPATIAAGALQQFTARGFDQNGQEIGGLNFAWTTSDAKVATIDQSGRATGINQGDAQITASSGGVTSAPATLHVNAPPVAAAGQVVINEALVSSAAPPPSPSPTPLRRDFVELYNTTDQTLDISGLVVSFRSSGTNNTPAVVTLPGAVGSVTTHIRPHSYFLIVNGASTYGVLADFEVQNGGFDLNNTTGGIKIELGGAKLDGITYQSGSTPPAAPFNAFGEGSFLIFSSGTTNDLIRSPNGADTNNNATDFKRNGTAASVTPKTANP
jgi:uncharacterized protein (TIGR03437 family)